MNFHSKIAENMPSGSAHISLIQSKAARLYDVETIFCRRWKCDFMSSISVGLNFSLSISKCRLNDDLIYY